MEQTGKIIAILPTRSGVSQSGKEWASQDAVLETQGQYPRKMVFTVFGHERINRFGLFVGMDANVQFDIDAHEYNGRWFNSITAYNIINVGTVTQQQEVQQRVIQQPAPPRSPLFDDTQEIEKANDLPF